MRAFSFLRFATPELGRRPTPAQSAAARAYCRRHGVELDAALHVRPSSIAGAGARTGTEAALEDFLERVHAGDVPKGSTLLIERLYVTERPAATAVAAVLKTIVESGVTVATLIDGSVYTRAVLKRDPSALLYAVVAFIRANTEAAAKSERVRESWVQRRERAQRKERISSICPAWLTLDRETQTFRVNRERARIVKRIYTEALRGAGQAQIAAALQHDGVPVFGRGTRWHRSYVLKVLRNPAVIGTYTPHTVEYADGKRTRQPVGNAIANYFPRIIDPDVFLQVQTLVQESRSPLRGRHARDGELANVFGGLLHCGRCGASVTLVSKGQRTRLVRYLVCSAARVNAGCRRYEAIPYERFERALLGNRDRLVAKARAGERRADLDQLIAEAEASANTVSDELEALLSRADRGLRTPAIHGRIRKLAAQRDRDLALADSLRAERETTTRAYVRDRVNELQAAWSAEPLDAARVNPLLRQVFSSITVDYDGADLAFLWRHGGQTEIDLGS